MVAALKSDGQHFNYWARKASAVPVEISDGSCKVYAMHRLTQHMVINRLDTQCIFMHNFCINYTVTGNDSYLF